MFIDMFEDVPFLPPSTHHGYIDYKHWQWLWAMLSDHLSRACMQTLIYYWTLDTIMLPCWCYLDRYSIAADIDRHVTQGRGVFIIIS